MSRSTDIQIRDVGCEFQEIPYRAPLKFGGVVVDSSILFNVQIRVQNGMGEEAVGRGSMPMGPGWAFPSQKLSRREVIEAVLELDKRMIEITRDCNAKDHPIELAVILKDEFLREAGRLTEELDLPEPIPKLCTLVSASPIDAALHDGFGKVNGINCYDGYGAGYVSRDLAAYLDDQFRGEYLDQYTLQAPKPRMPLYHLIGAVDPLTEEDISEGIDDGLPETLPEWIMADGLTHLKIKLTGEDLDWDVDRVLSIDRVTGEAQKMRGVDTWYYSADFNEKCEDVQYLIEFLNRVKESSPGAFERIQYIEQPTSRYLKEHPDNRMHAAAELKPVVIDEALQDYESFHLAREQGYSGVALKACKGHTQALFMAAAALKYNMFLCVQDLTCPGASFLHSAGIAARIPGVAAIEGNARQYCPAANEEWKVKYPGIFEVEDGQIGTGVLTRPGLGH